jgi:hypothetical protein
MRRSLAVHGFDRRLADDDHPGTHQPRHPPPPRRLRLRLA